MKKACLVGTNAPGPINLTLDIMSGPRTAKIPPKKTSINVADATTVSWKIFKNVGNFKLSRFSSFLPKNGATLSTNQIANCCWCPMANPPPPVRR